jgi:outer membrane receptor protein involved in Fe transport
MNYGLTKTRARLVSGAAILALSAGAAMAQEGVEQVVVSSTRLQSAGFDAPTPTTVVSSADLEASAKPNVFDAITQLPALQGSTGVGYNTGSTTTGLIGLSALGLRGLSPLRTLVLMDSQRVVGGNFNGVVDVSQMPQMLIQRVDVVTGGASASWGSDAVAGVVNFITEKKFEGFKMNAMAGLSTYGDMGNTLLQAAAGTSFAGGRAHFEVAGEYSYSDGLLPRYPVATQHGTNPENLGGRTLSRTSGTISYGSAGSTTVPPGMPLQIYGPNAQFQATGGLQAAYGVIKSGPLALTTFNAQGQASKLALAGGCVQNPTTGAISGVPIALGGGTVPSGFINGQCFGTAAAPGDQNSTREFTQGLYDPLTRGSLYARLSYDLTPSTEVYATFNYGVSRTQNTPAQGNSDKSGLLYCDNAYLPSMGLFGQGLNSAQTLAACNAAYAPTATQSTQNIAYGVPGTVGQIPYASQQANIPVDQEMFLMRTMRRAVVGADGAFSLFDKDWSWSSYFQHGETDTSIKIYNMPLSQNPLNPGTGSQDGSGLITRFNLAQDAVVNSAGQIVCRNVIAQANGCVPYNPLGGSINQGALAYFDNQNAPGGTTNGPSAIQTQRQEAFSFSVNGSPIEDWAGPVAVAAGYEYREEHYSQRADPYSAGLSASTPATVNEPCTDLYVDCGRTVPGGLGAWNAGNYHNGRGTYHVNEVFVEVGVPLINDSFWGKADLDLAGRHARYSTAGDANTWKVGVTWDTPVPGVRLRALQSRDIRAPNLSELFSPPQGLNGGFNNDFAKAQGLPSTVYSNQNIVGKNIGNPLLKPERSQTTQVGIVWQPDFIPGFQASVDYYRIKVQGAIQSLGSQTVEDLCFGGNAAFCSQNAITTANGQPQQNVLGQTGIATDPNAVVAIASQAFNAASLTTDGFDIESSYQFDLQDYDIPGSFTLRSLANHVSKFILDSGVAGTQRNQELAGMVGGGGNSQTYNQSGGNVLTWKLQETQSYQNDVWGINLTERWYADGTTTNKNAIVCAIGTCPTQTAAQQLQNPTINYNKVSSILYLDVGVNWNVSDKTQVYTRVENLTNIRPPDTGGQNVNNTLYDVVGRMYRIGVRFNN